MNISINESFKYVTEDSLRNSEIHNGSNITLGTAPDRLAAYVIKKIKEETKFRTEALIWIEVKNLIY
jgi:hypothetical protein